MEWEACDLHLKMSAWDKIEVLSLVSLNYLQYEGADLCTPTNGCPSAHQYLEKLALSMQQQGRRANIVFCQTTRIRTADRGLYGNHITPALTH